MKIINLLKQSGYSVREEMILDGQNVLKEELEHASSHSPTVYFYDPVLEKDDRPANLRIYNRKYLLITILFLLVIAIKVLS